MREAALTEGTSKQPLMGGDFIENVTFGTDLFTLQVQANP